MHDNDSHNAAYICMNMYVRIIEYHTATAYTIWYVRLYIIDFDITMYYSAQILC